MSMISNYVERLIVMHHGQVVLDGNTRSIFKHSDELEMLGLAAPQVTYIMRGLRKKGWNVSEDVITVEEAKKEILKALGKRLG